MNKKIYYVAVNMKGLKKYTYTNTKREAEQLKKNIDNLFNNKKVLTYIDFIWNSDKKVPSSHLHGESFKQTNTLIQDIKNYLDNYTLNNLAL